MRFNLGATALILGSFSLLVQASILSVWLPNPPTASLAPPLTHPPPWRSAQYWPAYSGLDPAKLNWSQTQIAYYFCAVTTASGIAIPAGQPTSDIVKFVSSARSRKSSPFHARLAHLTC